MIRHILTFLLFTTWMVVGQSWENLSGRHLTIETNTDIFLESGAQAELMFYRNIERPQSDRWWFMADSWNLGEPDKADLYFIFGHSENDSIQLWASGYSAIRDQIEMHRITMNADSTIALQLLDAKPVEIISGEQKYVLKLIFENRAGSFQMEVNGVPMKGNMPVAPASISIAGYLISKNSKTKFRPIRIRGDEG